MKLDTINRYFLSIFADSKTFNNNTDSIFDRFQILCNIYANLVLLFIVLPSFWALHLIYESQNPYMATLYCSPLVILGLYLLKTKQYSTASAMLIFSISIVDLITIYAVKSPGVVILSIIISPFITCCTTSSKGVHVLNTLLSGGILVCGSIEIKRTFHVTLNDEQTSQINLLVFGAFILYFISCLFCAFQKGVEMNIRESAGGSLKKAENVTKEVVEVMRAKDMFISMLSHELRNPLNALKGSIDFLAEIIKDYACLKVLKDAKLSCEILVNLINNVLDAAKLRSEKMEISHEEADVVDVVRKVLTISSKTFEKKKLSVQALVDKSIPKKIWIDSSRLLQILMNLISNAIKFTPDDGEINIYLSWCPLDQRRESLLAPFPEKITSSLRLDKETKRKDPSSSVFNEFSYQESEVRQRNFEYIKLAPRINSSTFSEREKRLLSFDSDDQSWIIKPTNALGSNARPNSTQQTGFLKVQVSDTGCGIAQQDIPKLFGMFEQVAQTSRSQYGGTGLGLWICKQLCQKMGGDITISSKINQGTTFVFYLQINNAHIDSSSSIPRLPRSDQRIRALVVDDQAVNCYLLSLLLEREGIKAQIATEGQEAINKYTKEGRASSYNFIIMDVSMPDMDGFTVANIIREWEKKHNWEKTDIYFVSGEYYDEEDIKTQFRKRGGQMDSSIKFLKKPIDGELLKKEVFPKYILKND
jgi:signal transduction histidine kinase/CheY-like chemotaxis protein